MELVDKHLDMKKDSKYNICLPSDKKIEFRKTNDDTLEISLEIVEAEDKYCCIISSTNESKGLAKCEPTEIHQCINGLKTLINDALIGENSGVIGIEYEDIKTVITGMGIYNHYSIENCNDSSLKYLKTEFKKLSTNFEANDKCKGIITITGNISFDEFEMICSLYEKSVSICNNSSFIMQLYPVENIDEIKIDVWTMNKQK